MAGLVALGAVTGCLAPDVSDPHGDPGGQDREPPGSVKAPAPQALVSANGLVSNGLNVNGIAFNGLNVNGITFNGLNVNGIGLNGLNVNGLNVNGLNVNGIALSGITLNGIALSGIALNGIALNGIALGGIALGGITLDSIALNGTTAANLKLVLRFLTECALPAGQCITATDLNGAPLTMCGAVGLDPAWAAGVPTLSRAGVMGQCVIDRSTAAGYTPVHYPVNRDNFKIVLKYMVECALPDGRSITYRDENDVTRTLSGALGLAPEWETGPPTPASQKRVSACLAARSNATGKTVQISIRARNMPLTTTLERTNYTRHEGAFWGNLFSSTPYVRTCGVRGGGLSGRLCTQPDGCGFQVEGQCSAICSSLDPVEGFYYGCRGADDLAAESEVVNVYLPFGNQVNVGRQDTCVRREDATQSLWCWGYNAEGEVGAGFLSDAEMSPKQVVSSSGSNFLEGALEASIGGDHACARRRDGKVSCWGRNQFGQLSVGTAVAYSSRPVEVGGLTDVAQISAGDGTTCARKTNGEVWCWGYGTSGQLGNGAANDSPAPVKVINLPPVASIGTGTLFSCALDNAGGVWCWGSGGFLGNGVTKQQSSVPVRASLDYAVDLVVGNRQSCAIKSDLTLWCWGDGTFGQLGNGSTSASTVPVRVLNLPGPVRGVASGGQHMCATLWDGTSWCWGKNERGQLGNGGSALVNLIPTQVYGATRGRVHSGKGFSSLLEIDGRVFGFGANASGQLGDGTTIDRLYPTAMTKHSCGNGVCEATLGENGDNCAADCARSCSVTDCDACGAAAVVTSCTSCGSHRATVTDCVKCGSTTAKGKTICNSCTITVCDTCPDLGRCKTCTASHIKCGLK